MIFGQTFGPFYLFRALEAALLVRPLRKGDLVRAAAKLAGRALPVLVTACPIRPVGRGLAV